MTTVNYSNQINLLIDRPFLIIKPESLILFQRNGEFKTHVFHDKIIVDDVYSYINGNEKIKQIFNDMQKSLTQNNITFEISILELINEHKEEIRNELNVQKAIVASLKVINDELIITIENLEERHKHLKEEHNNDLKFLREARKNDLDEFEDRYNKIKEKQDNNLKNIRQKYNEYINELDKKIDNVKQANRHMEKRIKNLRRENLISTKRIKRLNNNLTIMKLDNDTKLKEISQKQEELDTKLKEIKQKQEELDIKQEELNIMTLERNKYKNSLFIRQLLYEFEKLTSYYLYKIKHPNINENNDKDKEKLSKYIKNSNVLHDNNYGIELSKTEISRKLMKYLNRLAMIKKLVINYKYNKNFNDVLFFDNFTIIIDYISGEIAHSGFMRDDDINIDKIKAEINKIDEIFIDSCAFNNNYKNITIKLFEIIKQTMINFELYNGGVTIEINEEEDEKNINIDSDNYSISTSEKISDESSD